MVRRGEGYLVHTASAAGLLTQLGSAPYSVTKHAVVGLAEWLAITYGDLGVRCRAWPAGRADGDDRRCPGVRQRGIDRRRATGSAAEEPWPTRRWRRSPPSSS
jgi:NAD(P)-dependent dehydrogenase (short-subunit alcohol dehydrogenase family)